jgi:hypothetical protein
MATTERDVGKPILRKVDPSVWRAIRDARHGRGGSA